VLAQVKEDRDGLRQERDDWRKEAETFYDCAEKLYDYAEKLREADGRHLASRERHPLWRRLAGS
jgi:hypothetical protein